MRTIKNKDICPADCFFLTPAKLQKIIKKTGTPVCLYDEKGLAQRAKSLLSYPEKSASSIHYIPIRRCRKRELLNKLADLGFGAWCETMEELRIAHTCGFSGEKILYAAMCLSDELSALLREMNAVLLLGSTVLPQSVPERVDFVCNVPQYHSTVLAPCDMLHGHMGLTAEQIREVVPVLRKRGCASFGIALISDENVTDPQFLPAKLSVLQCLRSEFEKCGIGIARFNLGSGFGVQYHRDRLPADLSASAEKLLAVYHTEKPSELSFCLWRQLLDPSAILASSVMDVCEYRMPTIITDARADDLQISGVRRYRHISISGKEDLEGRVLADVFGAVPRNHAWLGQKHILPLPKVGDFLIMHDIGASLSAASDIPCYLVSREGELQFLHNCEK